MKVTTYAGVLKENLFNMSTYLCLPTCLKALQLMKFQTYPLISSGLPPDVKQ